MGTYGIMNLYAYNTNVPFCVYLIITIDGITKLYAIPVETNKFTDDRRLKYDISMYYS